MRLFLISDMDMTLIYFKHHLAFLKLKSFLESQSFLPNTIAQELCRCVQFYRENLTAQACGLPYDAKIATYIEGLAHSVQNKGDLDMRWSRELWLYAASVAMNKAISAQFAITAVDEYWKAIGRFGDLYEDVQEFFDSSWWKNSYWSLVVVTSSDLRLRTSGDEDRLVYDPEYSYFRKFKRIPKSIHRIAKNNMFIGDPVSKPHPSFWERVFINIGYNPEEDAAVMIGDVPKVDLAGLPYGVVPILIDRDNQIVGGDVKEAHYVIHSFDALPFILESVEAKAKERRN